MNHYKKYMTWIERFYNIDGEWTSHTKKSEYRIIVKTDNLNLVYGIHFSKFQKALRANDKPNEHEFEFVSFGVTRL